MQRLVSTLAATLSAIALVACSSSGTGGSTAPPATGGATTSLIASTTIAGDTASASTEPASTAPAATTPASQAEAILTVDQLQAALFAEHKADAWYSSITGMTLETHLGAQVLVLQVAWDDLTTDYTARAALLDPAIAAINAYDSTLAINIATRDVNGAFTSVGGGGSGVGMLADLVALPPAPTTPEELSAWLATVFGPGGLVPLGPEETWYSSITSIAMEDIGNGAQLMVGTTLGPSDSTELASLTLAVRLSASPLTAQWNVRGGGGFFAAWGGGVPSAPGTEGWYYILAG